VSLTLHVDADRWRAALVARRGAVPGIVPVIKGNGYGFGAARLAGEAHRLGVDTVAVGQPEEVAAVRAAYDGDVLVLAPWRPGEEASEEPGGGDPPVGAPRVVRTVSHLSALSALAGRPVPVVVEVLTSMRRHGIPVARLVEARDLLDGLDLRGVALHLPMAGDALDEARCLLGGVGAVLPVATAWVSHLSPQQVSTLTTAFPGTRIRLRSGTALWLGDRTGFRAAATVLDVHRLARGTTYGYRQRRMPTEGALLVLSGGTAHGIGLEAPKPVRGPAARARVLASGVLGAAGLTRSPYTVAGRRRWYAEPPHMQVSLVLLPGSVPPPPIGAEVAVDVRMTTTTFDRVVGL
jgi:hypothetical protein